MVRVAVTAAQALQAFLKHEAAAGIVLFGTALLAIVLDNSAIEPFYDWFLEVPARVQIGALDISKPLLLWINDGLMAIFFFLVGLEIKREVLEGQLSSRAQIVLPGAAAIGGMLLPAVIFVAFNFGSPEELRGWAIPSATDIAFALGVLALLGSRVPLALKVFLLAVAIIDDLGAIVIIAVFYTTDLAPEALLLAAIGLVVLILLNRFRVLRLAPYIIVGIAIWVCVLKSGVHATLAGVALAMTIPMKVPDAAEPSPLHRLEHGLHPWVAFGVMPLFAFANAGVTLTDIALNEILGALPLGIALGLFFGKQLGVMGAAWLTVRFGWARLPDGTSWMQLYGVALLTGIGFTMSLFIGTLAFSDPAHADAVRLGVLSGSLLSALVGSGVLLWSTAGRQVLAPQEE